MKRANIKILALILSLIVLPPLMWELKSQVGVVPGGSGGVPDNAVQGASNLTTAGAIPYVSSSGTLAQDSPALHWDAANDRLGLGTASPGYPLHILGGAGALLHVTNGTYSLSLDPSQGAFQGSANVSFLSGSSSDLFFGASSGTYKLTIKNSANSVGIGPSNTSPTGTLHVYDATPTTGVTTLTVRAGAGQGSTNLQEWKNVSAVTLASISALGAFNGAQVIVSNKHNINTASLALASDVPLTFQNGTSIFTGTPDLGLARTSANNLGITNGSSTTYATIGAGGALFNTGGQFYDATPTTGVTTLTVRAGAGQSTTNQFTLQTSAGLDFLRVRTNGVFGPVLETVTSGGLVPFSLGNESLQVASNWIMQWNNVGAAYNTPDLGLARDAAGRLKITDGSTGLGQIMIASSTPASAAATCSAGTFTWDASFFYICTATNTWRRVAHATW